MMKKIIIFMRLKKSMKSLTFFDRNDILHLVENQKKNKEEFSNDEKNINDIFNNDIGNIKYVEYC